ncbi:MAG TPA: MerR family transcriptional regulator [Hyphomicrobiales bacterium]|nr:MerR family transcriptional regulator [Hyphomicrobiales bacterium]
MKSPQAFRTISEVADDLDLPQHVLRFWETRFAQIKPLKRGGGRRYYRPDDVLLLRGIRQLLYGEGYTIKGVQRILREHGVRYVVGLGGDLVPASERAAMAGEDESEEVAALDRRIEPTLGETEDSAAEAEVEEAEADEAEEEGEGEATPAAPRPLPFAPIVKPPVAANDSGAGTSPRPLPGETERRLRALLAELIDCREALEREA